MSNCLVFEDGIVLENSMRNCTLWNGLHSAVDINGNIIKYIQTCLPENTLFVIPKSDGNVNRTKDNKYHDVDWDKQIQPYIDYAKHKNKVFMLGVLCQVDEEPDINYVYLPLDDDIFTNGINHLFNKNSLPSWESRSSELCWRGGCSGVGGLTSLRVRFVDQIFKYNAHTDVRLSTWWSANKNIPEHLFANRIHYTEFLKLKIFFIVDGNCVASSHMYGFASGGIPFVISNGICWFSHLLIPYIHYIPIHYDLSNLIEQIEWVNNNDDKAKEIANNATFFAETYFSCEYQQKHIKDSIDKYTLQPRPKIIDCFTFYNELDLLFYRLTLLNDVVDNFVLVESNYTHVGNKKILFYETNKHLFKRFHNKIIHIVVDLPHIAPNVNYAKNEQWLNENYQRNCINYGISTLVLNKNDLIIISDLDEIIDPHIALKFKNNLIEVKDGFTLSHDMYYYNLNTLHDEKWTASKIVTYEMYVKTSPQQIRTNQNLPILPNAGWHLSYFGDACFIKNKLIEFGHQELNNSLYTNETNIENAIKNNSDLFNRHYVPIHYKDITENSYLPHLYNTYLTKFVNQNVIETTPIYIYFHICCINNWEEIVSRLLFKIKNSGLYMLIKEIKCVILGDPNNSPIFNDPKINIICQSLDINLFESKTINLIYDDCIKSGEEFKILYIHSKGVRHVNNPKCEKNVYDWVELLSYFNIYNHKLCLTELNNCDAVGANLQSANDCPLHYSGNFWWSTSSHIKKINTTSKTNSFYNAPEFWVTSINGVYKSLWNSNTHHYNDEYPYFRYENKQINILIIGQVLKE
jgi:beta-1,4-mannosyl-glycoprotein beta-1,4-N-acetylglucosaminyltransferase